MSARRTSRARAGIGTQERNGWSGRLQLFVSVKIEVGPPFRQDGSGLSFFRVGPSDLFLASQLFSRRPVCALDGRPRARPRCAMVPSYMGEESVTSNPIQVRGTWGNA